MVKCYILIIFCLICQDWLSRVINWVKFSVIVGLGVIYRGYLQQGRLFMVFYLLQGGVGGGGSSYFEGGVLYVFGLIYVNYGEGIK